MVTKEPSEYYWLKGRYRFRNLITGRDAFVTGYSTPTRRKRRGKELQILREEAIDCAITYLSICLHRNRKECELQWVLVEILKEERQKL